MERNVDKIVKEWQQALSQKARPEKVSVFLRFFKTGKGEYGEGDKFIGLSVPDNRSVSRNYAQASLQAIERMLLSEIHEYRLAGFLALVARYTKSRRDEEKTEVTRFYAAHANCANNWDLVDLSAPYILGAEIVAGRQEDVLREMAASESLWRQRIAMVSTLLPIRHGNFELAEEFAGQLLTHPHPLMQKATGWMLREIGKRDEERLRAFLGENIDKISAVTLSYAIERLSVEERKKWRELRKNLR